MNALDAGEPLSRRERLAAIAEIYVEEVYEPRTAAQLTGPESVSRFAAITSEGSIESSRARDGNLIVADSPAELAERLRQEAEEGWLAHGRVWDLDLPWRSWGTLSVSVAMSVGAEPTRRVQVVVVEGRQDGIYVFDEAADVGAFREAIRRGGEEVTLSEQPVHGGRVVDRLTDVELRRH
jgi:hypothetical protein